MKLFFNLKIAGLKIQKLNPKKKFYKILKLTLLEQQIQLMNKQGYSKVLIALYTGKTLAEIKLIEENMREKIAKNTK